MERLGTDAPVDMVSADSADCQTFTRCHLVFMACAGATVYAVLSSYGDCMKTGFPLICGLIFGIGLTVSGMTQPAKVIGFLDIMGTWDRIPGLRYGWCDRRSPPAQMVDHETLGTHTNRHSQSYPPSP